MAKAKKNATRSGKPQRKHTKQHMTHEELDKQKVAALSRIVETAHKYVGARSDGHYAPNTKENLVINWKWGTTPRKPYFTITKDAG